jgi:hypothetical protein
VNRSNTDLPIGVAALCALAGEAVCAPLGQSGRVAENVAVLTRLLRESDDEMWAGLRAALARRGIDVLGSMLAFSVEQGDDSEFGVLVTADDVVTFSWRPSTAFFVDWTPITGWWRDSPYRAEIEQAVRLRSNT